MEILIPYNLLITIGQNIMNVPVEFVIAGINIIGIPVIGWAVNKIRQIHRDVKGGQKYNQLRHESLVDALHREFGNGFRSGYYSILESKVKEEGERNKYIRDYK